MPKNQRNRSNRSSDRSAFGWADTAREKPFATAAAVGAAAAAGAFLWSRRNQISEQISNLSDQFSEWSESMGSSGNEDFELESTGVSSGASRRSVRGATGMSETGGGNASLGAQTGGSGITGSASGRGRARPNRTT